MTDSQFHFHAFLIANDVIFWDFVNFSNFYENLTHFNLVLVYLLVIYVNCRS